MNALSLFCRMTSKLLCMVSSVEISFFYLDKNLFGNGHLTGIIHLQSFLMVFVCNPSMNGRSAKFKFLSKLCRCEYCLFHVPNIVQYVSHLQHYVIILFLGSLRIICYWCCLVVRITHVFRFLTIFIDLVLMELAMTRFA